MQTGLSTPPRLQLSALDFRMLVRDAFAAMGFQSCGSCLKTSLGASCFERTGVEEVRIHNGVRDLHI